MFAHRYTQLFNQNRVVHDIPPTLLGHSVTEENNRTLCALATLDEFKEVVRGLSTNRVPRIDGFNGGFYCATWPIISNDLLAVINNFLHSEKLLAQANHTLLCMVPKKKIPASVNDFWPLPFALSWTRCGRR